MIVLLFSVLIFDENLLQPVPNSISGTGLRPKLVRPQSGDGVVRIDILHALLRTPVEEKRKRFWRGTGGVR